MGQNRTYADRYANDSVRRAQAKIMAEGAPESLKDFELELDKVPRTIPPVPPAVHVWVRYGALTVQVNAFAVAWTAHAVAVVWETPQRAEHRAWVWRGAVRSGHRKDLEQPADYPREQYRPKALGT